MDLYSNYVIFNMIARDGREMGYVAILRFNKHSI